MSEILITGGTGLLGREILRQLAVRNQKASILSRQLNPGVPAGVEVLNGDLVSGEGLSAALENVKTIIHCASNPSAFQEADIIGTRNLLQLARKYQLPHLIYISIVGVDQSTYPYYQAKKQVEDLIASSGVPFTILRTTQFHHFVYNLIKGLLNTESKNIHVPDGMKFQSVELKEVAARLISAYSEEPAGLLADFGGPEVFTFEEMLIQYLDVFHERVGWEAVPLAGPRYDLFRSGLNLCPHHKAGSTTWKEFLTAQVERQG